MINIYVDMAHSAEHSTLAMPMLEPLLCPEKMKDPAKSAQPKWKPHYNICSSPELADVFMLKADMQYYVLGNKMNIVEDMLEQGKKYKKPVWIFSGGDYGITPQNQNLNVLRLGGHSSNNAGNQFVMPPFIIDPLKYAENDFWKPLSWEEVTSVGFCGLADEGIARQVVDNVRNVKRYVAKLLGQYPLDLQPFFSTTALRGKVLKTFEATAGLETDFIKRKKYKAGANTAEAATKVKQEYYQNLYNNPYTVCLRGAGNYSIRFYDCLASGRIPAYINTDAMLPLPNIIDWSQHCFLIEKKDLATLGNKFLAFHQGMSKEKFETIQQSNRTLWERYLTYDGFFSHFHLLPPNQSFAHLY